MTRKLVFSAFASAYLFVACANGGDPGGDDPGGGTSTSEASAPGQDTGTSPGTDSSTPTNEASATGDDAGTTADSGTAADTSTVEEADTTQDAGDTTDTGTTTTQEAGTQDASTQDTGTTSTGGVCGSSGIYAVEAAEEVASGTITFCFSGTCSAGYCCYEELDPGNICVKQ